MLDAGSPWEELEGGAGLGGDGGALRDQDGPSPGGALGDRLAACVMFCGWAVVSGVAEVGVPELKVDGSEPLFVSFCGSLWPS